MAKRGIMTVGLVGQKEAIERMKKVVELCGSEAVQDELMPAATLIRNIAKSLVRVGPEKKTTKIRPHIRDLIFAVKGMRPKPGLARLAGFINSDYSSGPSVIVGVDRKRAPHAHLLEFGHLLVRGGRVIKQVAARPFLRPAADSAKPLVVSIIENGLRKLLAPFTK